MLPEIASINDRMAEGGDWSEFREEIAELHKKAKTQEEYEALLRAHWVLGRLIDQVFDDETAEQLKAVHHSEYLLFLIREASEGGELANPAMLDKITAREVESGRLAADDDFRQLANDGGRVIGDSSYTTAKAARPGDWFAIGVAVVAIILWVASVHPLGFSALWLIAIGLVGGWFLNDREATRIKHGVEVERARRGY